jgi:chemotaxis protein MotB
MARKAAWEDAADLGPYAKRGGTSWGRVFVLVLVVGIGTFVAAYYLPLYRSQQKLSEQYRDLSQKAQTLTDTAAKAQADLKSVTSERDQLQAEHDQRESAKKSETDQLERLRSDLSAKLDKLVKKGSAAVTTNAGSVLVGLDDAALFMPQKLDLSPAGKALLCDVAKNAQSLSIRVSGSMAEGATVPPALEASYGSAWGVSAARAAAVTTSLEDKCTFPAAQLTAVSNGKQDPFQVQLASLKAPERVTLELRARSAK